MEELTFQNLIAGNFPIMADEVTLAASQTVQLGDLLELKQTLAADTGDGAVTGTAVSVNSETHVATVTEGAADTGDGSIDVTAAASYARPSAKADPFSCYAVAAEAVTTGSGATAKIRVFRTGEFNEAEMRFGGSSTAAQNRDVLAAKGIFLRQMAKA